ncbi:TIGR01777 family oxidoreductase [Corynebacterium sp. 335C]
MIRPATGIRSRESVAADPAEVAAWFAAPGAVVRLTPGLAPMSVERGTCDLAGGETVLRLPAGRRWVARHDPSFHEVAPDRLRFADDCVGDAVVKRAVRWRHEHLVAPDGAGGTLLSDDVDARVPEAALRPVFRHRAAVVAGDIEGHRLLRESLDDAGLAPAAAPGPDAPAVAVSGATGTVGTQLAALLRTRGHRVVELTRPGSGEPGPIPGGEVREWDPESPAPDLLDGVGAVVHLAGAPIFGRFTDRHLATVRASRIGPTRRLAELAAASGVGTFVSASAVGWYGPDNGGRGDEPLDESAPAGRGDLAGIVAGWEAAADPAREAGLRVVTVRTGLVQAGAGGMLPLLAAATFAGGGGPLGDGRQWMSWIALDDLLEVYHRAVVDPRLSGPVNATAPEPVRNEGYAGALAGVLHRPSWLRVPRLGPAALLGGRGADEFAMASQRAVPAALEAVGHRFRRADLRAALAHELLRG